MAALAGAGLLCWRAPWRANEPSYRGRRLTAWLADGSYWSSVDDPRAPARLAEARQAIRQIGEEAVPCLLNLLSEEDSRLRSKAAGWVERGARRYFAGLHAYELRSQAVWGFEVLGSRGRPALPRLQYLFLAAPRADRLGNEVDVGLALAGIGADALPILARGLTNQHRGVRFAALEGLERLNARYPAATRAAAALDLRRRMADAAVSSLIQMMRDEDPLRGPAATLLGKLGAKPEQSVPALMEFYQRSPGYPIGRRIALTALANFGPDARPAAPLFALAAQDADPAIRSLGQRGLAAVGGNP